MTDAFTCHVPITAEIYARIKDGLGPQIPPGMIAHLAYRTEAGLRYVDVWQTKNDLDAFEHGRLHPVVHPLLQDMLGFVPPEPPKTALDIVNAWTAGARPDRMTPGHPRHREAT
jgi:hypothetical protein